MQAGSAGSAEHQQRKAETSKLRTPSETFSRGFDRRQSKDDDKNEEDDDGECGTGLFLVFLHSESQFCHSVMF